MGTGFIKIMYPVSVIEFSFKNDQMFKIFQIIILFKSEN